MGLPVNLRLLSLTLVVVIVGALVASSYADGPWVLRVLAKCPGEPVEGVTSDCGPGCRDDGGGGCRVPCQTAEDCECLYGPGWWFCDCRLYCAEIDYARLEACAREARPVCINCVIACAIAGMPKICAAICPSACLGYALFCLYDSCVRWSYDCKCVRLPDNMPVGREV